MGILSSCYTKLKFRKFNYGLSSFTYITLEHISNIWEMRRDEQIPGPHILRVLLPIPSWPWQRLNCSNIKNLICRHYYVYGLKKGNLDWEYQLTKYVTK